MEFYDELFEMFITLFDLLFENFVGRRSVQGKDG